MQVRTQPEIIIQRLEADNSRLVKEDILAEAMKEAALAATDNRALHI